MHERTSSVRSRRIPARRESVVHPRSLNSGDFALGFYRCLLARSSQRLSQWHRQNDYEGVLHVICVEPSDAGLPKCVMKPAMTNDLFRKLHSRLSRNGQCGGGKAGQNVLETCSETLSLEPSFSILYNGCYSSANQHNEVRSEKDDRLRLPTA